MPSSSRQRYMRRYIGSRLSWRLSVSVLPAWRYALAPLCPAVAGADAVVAFMDWQATSRLAPCVDVPQSIHPTPGQPPQREVDEAKQAANDAAAQRWQADARLQDLQQQLKTERSRNSNLEVWRPSSSLAHRWLWHACTHWRRCV